MFSQSIPKNIARFILRCLTASVLLLILLTAILLGPPSSLGQTNKGISKTSSETAPGDPRTALVIGNADYESAPLRNPVNDAREIAKTLRGLGFSVQLLEDASQKQMKRAIDRFGEQLRDGGVGLFYYSGHGIQVSGRNYLVPLKAEIASEQDVEYESVDAGRVLAKMDAARNGMNLVILDACRNNPYARSFRSASQGLATLNAPSGTFIAYATAPGSVASDGTGRNGLYTGELVRHMNTPGLKLEEVFKRVRADVQEKSGNAQVPWDASSLTGDFFFVSPEEKPEPAAVATLTPTPLPSSAASQFLADEELWKELKDSDSPEDFEDFLAAFPESKLAPVARIKLKRIKRKQAKAKAEEQQLAVEEKRQEEERKQLEAEKQKIAEAKRKAEKTLAEEAKLQSDSSLILTLSNPVQKTIIRNSKHPKGNVEITYSVWIKPDHYTGYGSPAMSVIDVGCCRTNSRSSLLLHANKNSASIHYVAHGNDIGLRNANIPYDKWSHVILVKKGTKIRVYIDGEYRADGQIKRGQNVTSNNIYIGHSPQGEVFRGKLKDIKIWDREFSAAEIDSHQSKPTEAQPGTVIDQATGLMWQKKSDGTKRNWDAAKSYCSNLTFGGYSDWELPSKEVLEDMLEKKDLFDPFRRGDWYWSSSSGVGFASYAWSVSFGYGNVISTHPNGSYYSRCVRGGQ